MGLRVDTGTKEGYHFRFRIEKILIFIGISSLKS